MSMVKRITPHKSVCSELVVISERKKAVLPKPKYIASKVFETICWICSDEFSKVDG
jgi:hypothetical protein